MDSSVDSIVIDQEFDEKEFKHQERRIGIIIANYEFKIDIMPQFPDYKQYKDLQSLTPYLQEILKVKSSRLGLFFEGVRNLSKQDQFYEIEFYKDNYQFQEEQLFGTDSMGIFVYEDFQLQENFGNFQECKLVQDVLYKLKTISLYNDDDEELELKNFRNFCLNLKNFKHFTKVHMVGSNDINFYLDNYFKRTREISKETFKEWTFNQCQEGLKKMKKNCQDDCQQGYYGHFYINDFFKIYPNYGIGVGCSYCKQLCQEINDEIISKFEKVFKRKFVSTNILEMKSDKNIFMNQAVSRIDKENK
ncbi:hypothetical protein PPERSA_00502 [Pseudocohnilembus persalinus]|uniref:Uncharacterized protein n=1 Tax=Pseudocohnilembus persalinus TaxID=266149 RepID=A0A0V0R8B0_PSEPJ|nr:hypothetical protein PPERSA_00502 [Pseudocohnilembus persalinus]|eukprot:KRX10732.1 hypothetical protein PPERSA_00502 [Pseudocohnilembus persalinus]